MLGKELFDYYIGFATDSSDRYKASSGGIGTAITRYLLSQPDYGTSVTFVFDERLCMYVPKMIYSESEINVCGSIYQDIDIVRYVKEHVDEIKDGIVLSCAPCQVSAIKAILDRKKIKNFIISYCCSGQTTIEGTWCYYRLLGISKKDVVNMQYRGNGWPGGIQIWLKDGSVIQKDNWTEPWVSIHRSGLFKPKRCLFCKLDLGYRADISLADPWLERFIVNEKKGATLCVLTSEKGKKIFRDVLTMNRIEAFPSSYDEYAVAEAPNVHKELNLLAEKKYRKRMSKLVGSRLYRKIVARNRGCLALHIRILLALKFFSQEISCMQMLCKIIEKIKRKIRVRSYKKKLGGYDTNFSIGVGCVMNNPQCVYFGKNVGVGANTFFGPVISYAGIAYNPKIIVGEGTWIGKNCSIAAMNMVEIGKNVLFAGCVHITDHSHGYEDISKPVDIQPLISKGPVIIEDDCWLGFNCEILSGVHIGKHCVVAARSVVTKDVPAYSVVAGNPARVIKRYNEISKKWERV